MDVVNALSVDVEEYYHGMEFEAAVPAARRPELPSRVEWNTGEVLEALGRLSVRATFFVVGNVARAHPELVKTIAAAGHEVACHSDRHELVWRMSPKEFEDDLRAAKATLEDLSGRPVVGYRAPNYSIGPEQSWAWAVLGQAGFQYDSSIYPIHHDRYGLPDAPRFPYTVYEEGKSRLVEFPLGTLRLLGMNLPIGGGGIFRLFPGSWIRRGIERVNRNEGRPIMFYFHPWELDPHQPRPPMPFHHRFRHYVNLSRYKAKLERLLRRVPFAPAREVLALS